MTIFFPGRPSIEQFLQLANSTEEASRFADVTLVVGSRRLRCHKLLLAAHSQFLRDLLLERHREDEEDCVITLAEAEVEEVEGVLAFAYSGSILDDRLLEYGLNTLRLVRSGEGSKIVGTPEYVEGQREICQEDPETARSQRRKGQSKRRRKRLGSGEKTIRSDGNKAQRLECCDERFDEEIFYVTHKVRVHSAEAEKAGQLLPGGRGDKFIICCDEKITNTFKGHLEETHKLDASDKSVCCDDTFDNLHGLTKHCKTRHGLRLATYKRVLCCATRLNNLEEYKRHKDSEHLECKLCTFMSKDERHLSLHLYSKHNVGTKPPPLACKFCGKSFTRSHQRQDHEDRHEERPKYSCEVCSKSFRLVSSLRSHLSRLGRNHNPEAREYSCDSCDKTFNTVVAKRKHTRTTHEQRETPTCSECEMTFMDRHSLDNHFKVAHIKVKDIQCSICGKLYSTQERMRNHERFVHVVEVKKVPCDICSKEFCNKERMIDHRRSVHRDRKYQCESCGSTFKNSSTLKSHVVSIHLDHDKKPLKCQECGKGFLHESRLRAHEMIHSDEAPYSCQFCARPNKCKNNNIKHERRCKKRVKSTATTATTDASGTLVPPLRTTC